MSGSEVPKCNHEGKLKPMNLDELPAKARTDLAEFDVFECTVCGAVVPKKKGH